MVKNLVCTLNVGHDGLHQNARSSIREAARRWGCDYMEIVSSSENGLHHWQEKIHLDEHLPDECRVLYFDGDVVVRCDCPSPFEIVPEGQLGWTRADHPSHSGSTHHVRNDLPRYAMKVGAEVDPIESYPNTGFMLFDLPAHRPLFEEARAIVSKHGWHGTWTIADQGNFACARERLKMPVFWMPPMFNFCGQALWAGWTAEQKTFAYHFCGPISKNVAIPRTCWDDLGPDRVVSGTRTCRWKNGKPVSLSEGAELPFLIREFSKIRHGNIVEVGSYFGGLTWYGGQIARDNYSTWTSVDSWTGASDLKVDEIVYQGFLENLRDANLDGIVKHVKAKSVEAAKTFEDASLDLAFIDGDHSKAGVLADIEAYWPKLKTGGVMLGHDYTPRLQGVIDAVNERFGKPDELSDGEYRVWKVTKRE